MDKKIKMKVRELLTNYLNSNRLRKTPERYAILDAVYDIGGHFSLEQLGVYLTQKNFVVSRGTLYNTMHLFMELRLVTCHRFGDGTKYEACYANDGHCHQICTVCGKVTEINSSKIVKAIDEIRFNRFRKDGFTLYIYGVCTNCQLNVSRKKNNI